MQSVDCLTSWAAHSFADYTWSKVEASVAQPQKAVAVESPGRSWLWAFKQAKSMHYKKGWRRDEYYACAHGACRRKFQAIESNVEDMQMLAAQCHHTHSKDEWGPYLSQVEDEVGTITQEWVYPGSAEAEYTAALAFNIALALSWWAIRVLGIKIRIPRAVGPEESGNREGWARMPAAAPRRWMMAPLATRLPLEPPAQSPGPWFAEEWLSSARPSRVSADTVAVLGPADKDKPAVLPPDVVYVGHGNAKLRLPAGPWTSPFQVGIDGTAEHIASAPGQAPAVRL